MTTVNLSTPTYKTIYFPLNFHFRMIYNPNNLKEILPANNTSYKWGNRFIISTRNFFMSQNVYYAMEKKQLK